MHKHHTDTESLIRQPARSESRKARHAIGGHLRPIVTHQHMKQIVLRAAAQCGLIQCANHQLAVVEHHVWIIILIIIIDNNQRKKKKRRRKLVRLSLIL